MKTPFVSYLSDDPREDIGKGMPHSGAAVGRDHGHIMVMPLKHEIDRSLPNDQVAYMRIIEKRGDHRPPHMDF